MRAKVYYDIFNDLILSFSGLYSSSFCSNFGTLDSRYQLEKQRFDPIFGEGGNEVLIGRKHDNRFMLNVRVGTYFMDKKLNVFAYGQDVTRKTFTENIWQLEFTYPRPIGAMFGVGLKYTLQ